MSFFPNQRNFYLIRTKIVLGFKKKHNYFLNGYQVTSLCMNDDTLDACHVNVYLKDVLLYIFTHVQNL